VLPQPAPGLLLDLQPEPLGHALLDPPHQDGGRVGAGHVNGLVRGEQRDPGQGELLLQLQRVVAVTAGPLDVLTDHGGEPRRGAGGFGEQISQPAVTRPIPANCSCASPWPRASVGRPPDSMSQNQAAMYHFWWLA